MSPYRIMWLQVIFDLPTTSKSERKAAMKFRTMLIDTGFEMLQYSVYLKCCADNNAMSKYKEIVKMNIPNYGKVCILHFTDKQFELMESFYQKKESDHQISDYQMELF